VISLDESGGIMPDWLRLELSVAQESSERVIAELWTLGTVGLEERSEGSRCLIRAFFPAESSLAPGSVRLTGGFWRSLEASLDSVETIADCDWTESYRRGARPFPLGRGFVVDPREPGSMASPEDPSRRVLRLPARRAFGIGSHESTRLVVEWLEDLDLRGLRVLDVGAGTGILSLVAIAGGAGSVVAVEIDPVAAFLGGANQHLNGVRFGLVAGDVRSLDASSGFDLLLVNVLPENIAGHLGHLSDLARPGGVALFSGILSAGSDRFAGLVADAGFAIEESRAAGEWEAWMALRGDL